MTIEQKNITRPIVLPNIIDFEASGFGHGSYPIEVGVVKSNGDRYCSLIRPQTSWNHWSTDAENLHHISQATLVKKGKPIRDVCFDLNEFLREEEVFSDAWSHDQNWLLRLYRAAQIHPSFNLRAIEFLLTEAQLQLWDDAKCRVFGEHSYARHRASNDAYLIQQTFTHIYSDAVVPATSALHEIHAK